MSSLTVLQDVYTVQLSQGMNALVDFVDFNRVAALKWHVRGNGYSFYAHHSRALGGDRSKGERKFQKLPMHRFVLNETRDDFCVDHRDGDSLNNTRANLRSVTGTQNKQNRRRVCGESRFKGVFRKGNRWMAKIKANKIQTYLGTFATQEEAARVYDVAVLKLHGEFAVTNRELLGEF